MIVDLKYCMSSFLMYRFIVDQEKCFCDSMTKTKLVRDIERNLISDSYQLEEHLRKVVRKTCENRKAAIALSGGIDSAILAKFMPEGATAYTFRCIVPGCKVTDETEMAARYAKECGLKHKVIDIYWEDFEKYASLIMRAKNCPTHSIEIQIYKASLQAKKDGFDTLIFGETADCVYGGHSNLLSRDWTIGEFADRWSFVKPYYVLKDFEFISEPYMNYSVDGWVDVPRFLSEFEYYASLNFYINATKTAGMDLVAPYAYTKMKEPLDLKRIRSGENKYLVRELFSRLYPDWIIPPKTPMPRPMNEWLSRWKGPSRNEFLPNCQDGMTGDQKWLVYSLELFMNDIDL